MVATNWDEATRAETTPESDYGNNQAYVPIEVNGNSARVLTASEVSQYRDANC